MLGGTAMGFFSNLFKKKENPQPAAKVSFVEKTGLASHDPEIPPFQGDYAKTIFLWAHNKASPVKLRGIEHRQPHSSSFACIFPYLPCLASARLRHLRKNPKQNSLLWGAAQF